MYDVKSMIVTNVGVAPKLRAGELRLNGGKREPTLSAFRPRGVPGPTSKIVAACPSLDGSARDGTHGGGGGENRGSCYPAPRADALAVGGYKRSRGRACEPVRRPVLPRDHPLV
jgi:hypothetical protein